MMYLDTEVRKVTNKSRADYFKQRRESLRQFNVDLPKDMIESLERALEEQKKTKTMWLKEKISEELQK